MSNSPEEYKLKFNRFDISMDEKPGKRDRRFIAKKSRQWSKKLVQNELEDHEAEFDVVVFREEEEGK